jgi:PhzF family phenazine biosynthesis protein
LSDAERLRVPQLTGCSHAAFVSAGDREIGDSRVGLRFFTEEGELPACGHGTVAALVFLAEHAARSHYQVTLLESGRSFAGQVRHERGRLRALFDAGRVQLREATAQEQDLVLDALVRSSGALTSEITVASIGRPRLLVPISSRSELAGLEPDLERLRAGCNRLGVLGCYVHSLPTSGGHLAARMFAPAIGVPEDIANANSTACLAAKMARGSKSRITVDMGDSLGRPATITAETWTTVSGLQIRVGGTAEIDRTVELHDRTFNTSA